MSRRTLLVRVFLVLCLVTLGTLAFVLWDSVWVVSYLWLVTLALMGTLPVALGFSLQWVMRNGGLTPIIRWLAVLMAVAFLLYITDGAPMKPVARDPVWLRWLWAGLTVPVFLTFLKSGAALCRRCFPQRF